MKVKDIVAGTILAAGLGVGALTGAGVASAIAPSPLTPGTPWAEKPHHGDWDDWDDRGHGGWGHGNWGHGGGWYPGIQACVSATGPWGYVQGSVCI